MSVDQEQIVSRRVFVIRSALSLAGLATAACAPTATPTPTARIPESTALTTRQPTPTAAEEPLVWILARDNLTNDEFREWRYKIDAAEPIRDMFKPAFLTDENLGGELEVEPLPVTEDGKRSWQTPKRDRSKLDATVVNDYSITNGKPYPRDLGPQSVATIIEGQVRDFPWGEGPVKVKNADDVFKHIGDIFELSKMSRLEEHVSGGRTDIETGERVDLVMALTGKGMDNWGRNVEFVIYPGGEFRFTFTPKQTKP